MAIEGRINFKGIPVENSYIKVKSVMIDNKNKTLHYTINYYANEEQKKIDSVLFAESYKTEYNFNDGNAIKQSYEHYKTSKTIENSKDI